MPEFVLSQEAEADLDEIHARISVDKASTFTPRLPSAPTGVAIAAPTADESIGGEGNSRGPFARRTANSPPNALPSVPSIRDLPLPNNVMVLVRSLLRQLARRSHQPRLAGRPHIQRPV
jgi:hypothetical protein